MGGPGAGDPNSKRTGGQAVVRQKVKNEVSQHGRGIKKSSAGRSAGKWGSEGEGVCTQGAEARRECEFLFHVAYKRQVSTSPVSWSFGCSLCSPAYGVMLPRVYGYEEKQQQKLAWGLFKVSPDLFPR